MKINNEKELQKYLDCHIKYIGSYALVTYNNHTEVIWIAKHSNHREDGSNWYLESSCDIHKYDFRNSNDEDIRKYVEEIYEEDYIEEGVKYVKSMIRDGWLYEIDSPQTAPFLPEVLDDLTLISEEYCLDWMLSNEHIK